MIDPTGFSSLHPEAWSQLYSNAVLLKAETKKKQMNATETTTQNVCQTKLGLPLPDLIRYETSATNLLCISTAQVGFARSCFNFSPFFFRFLFVTTTGSYNGGTRTLR
jgi:hypothetical protein